MQTLPQWSLGWTLSWLDHWSCDIPWGRAMSLNCAQIPIMKTYGTINMLLQVVEFWHYRGLQNVHGKYALWTIHTWVSNVFQQNKLLNSIYHELGSAIENFREALHHRFCYWTVLFCNHKTGWQLRVSFIKGFSHTVTQECSVIADWLPSLPKAGPGAVVYTWGGFKDSISDMIQNWTYQDFDHNKILYFKKYHIYTLLGADFWPSNCNESQDAHILHCRTWVAFPALTPHSWFLTSVVLRGNVDGAHSSVHFIHMKDQDGVSICRAWFPNHSRWLRNEPLKLAGRSSVCIFFFKYIYIYTLFEILGTLFEMLG